MCIFIILNVYIHVYMCTIHNVCLRVCMCSLLNIYIRLCGGCTLVNMYANMCMWTFLNVYKGEGMWAVFTVCVCVCINTLTQRHFLFCAYRASYNICLYVGLASLIYHFASPAAYSAGHVRLATDGGSIVCATSTRFLRVYCP